MNFITSIVMVFTDFGYKFFFSLLDQDLSHFFFRLILL